MNDEYFMRLAIKEARNALFPFGCVLVKKNFEKIGKTKFSKRNFIVIAKGKSGEIKNDPTAHAEINAIRTACEKLHSRELSGVTLYSTCEPCPMCFSASWWANVSRIVYGVSLEESSRLFGQEILVSVDYLNKKGANKIKIKGGILKDEILEFMKNVKTIN